MATSSYDISGIDLTDNQYTVEQSLIRNKYKAMDTAGTVVLRGKQKLFKAKESFPFVDANDEEVFEVNASGILDVAGTYVLTDSRTGEDVVVLDNDFSLFQDTWRLRDPDTEAELARIDSRGALVTLARSQIPFGGLLFPHKYEITDSDGQHVGNIDGQLSIRDRYKITIDDASSVPKEAVIAAAMVIDAIQGN
jgi:uncharacterized protein YxjI